MNSRSQDLETVQVGCWVSSEIIPCRAAGFLQGDTVFCFCLFVLFSAAVSVINVLAQSGRQEKRNW